MILAAVLAAPALAQPVPGAVKVSFADIFGWWLPLVVAARAARRDRAASATGSTRQ